MSPLTRVSSLVAAAGAALLLAGCERPPMDSVQSGYRGTGMVQVYNPRAVTELEARNQVPPSLPPAPTEGPRAGAALQNVKVLGHLSVAEFTSLMTAMTAWVSPNEGCTYCHDAQNFADDSKYTKIVARRMLQMTQHINADWKQHVAGTGVTCYTCHRGQPVPSMVWSDPVRKPGGNYLGQRNGQNAPSPSVGLSSLPADPFSPYLKKTEAIRVAGTTSLPTDHVASIQATEGTYALMMHMSSALGVNCTFCHNSRSFGTWDQSSPQRTTAWHGIRMVVDLNNAYLEPLGSVLPTDKRGPAGDGPKVACATCHQGAYKPLYGVSMTASHPGLLAPAPAAPAASAAAATRK